MMMVMVLITMAMFGTFRSAVANSRGAVAGARDVVAIKEHRTYDDDTLCSCSFTTCKGR